MADCMCFPVSKDGYEFSRFIGHFFHDCVYTPLDYASFVIGWVSMGLFFFALLPQIFVNYRNKSVDALSPFFLAQWLLGDIFNLIGCILAHQLLTQTMTAIYFCLVDAVMVFQMFYYWRRNNSGSANEEGEALAVNSSDDIRTTLINDTHHSREEGPAADESNAHPSRLSTANSFVLLGLGALVVLQVHLVTDVGSVDMFSSASRALLAEIPNCLHMPSLNNAEKVLASFVSWASGLLYFCSRIPQVYKNYEEKSTEGLSVHMFLLTISSNVTYGLSIIFRFPALNDTFWADTLPFLVGSIGTLVFDFIVIYQVYIYRHNHTRLHSHSHSVRSTEDALYKSF